MRIIEQLYLSLYCLLLLVIPFTELVEAIPNILIVLLALLFPFVIKRMDIQNIITLEFLGLLGLGCILIFQAFCFGRLEDLKFISKIFLLTVFLVLSIPILIKENTKKLIYSFLLGLFCLLIVSTINVIKEGLELGNFDLSVGSKINTLLMGDRPYVGFSYTIGFFTSIFLTKNTRNKKGRFLLLIFASILIGFLFLIAARTSLLSIIIAGLFSLFYIKSKKVRWSIFLLTVILAIIIVFFNQGFKERLTQGFKQQSFSLERIFKLEPRYHIWGCAKLILENNSPTFFGYGFLESQNKLYRCYQESQSFINKGQKEWFIYKNYNTHNQYLNFYLSTGLFGFIYFILICFSYIKKYKNNFICLSLIFSMLIFFMFENVLSRQMGVELCAVVLIFSNGINLLKHE